MNVACIYLEGEDCVEKRPFFILYNKTSANKLWVSDIFVCNLDNTLFSYNLWWIKLTIDRHTYASQSELLRYIGKIWSSPKLPDIFFDILVDNIIVDKGKYITIHGDFYELHMGSYADNLFYERLFSAIKNKVRDKICYTDNPWISQEIYDLLSENGYKVLYLTSLYDIKKYMVPLYKIIDSITNSIGYKKVQYYQLKYYMMVGLAFIGYILDNFMDYDTEVGIYIFSKDDIECYSKTKTIMLSYRYIYSINKMIELFIYSYPEALDIKKASRLYESKVTHMARRIAELYERINVLSIRRNIFAFDIGACFNPSSINSLIYDLLVDININDKMQVINRIASHEMNHVIKNDNVLLTVYELVFSDLTGDLYMIYDLTDMVTINNEYVLNKTLPEIKEIIDKEINRILEKIKNDYKSGILYNYGDKHSEFIFLYPKIKKYGSNGYTIKHVNIKSL